MAHVAEIRVRETTTTESTGAYTVDGAVANHDTFASVMSEGDTARCAVIGGADWEEGVYTLTSGTLVRTVVERSSNADAAVNWGAGTKQIIMASTPWDAVTLKDPSGNEALTWVFGASRVNHPELSNAATGNAVQYGAAGDDANVGINLESKADGDVTIGSGTSPSAVTVYGATGNIELSDKVGIGRAPTQDLDVYKGSGDVTAFLEANAGDVRLYLDAGGASTTGSIVWRDDGNTKYELYYDSADGSLKIKDNAAAANRVEIDTSGNVTIQETLYVADGGTTAAVAGHISLYSTAGEAYLQDDAGNATLQTSHPSDGPDEIYRDPESGKLGHECIIKQVRNYAGQVGSKAWGRDGEVLDGVVVWENPHKTLGKAVIAESFDEYNKRRGLTPEDSEYLVPIDFDEQQSEEIDAIDQYAHDVKAQKSIPRSLRTPIARPADPRNRPAFLA